jgi:hypothetical protein
MRTFAAVFLMLFGFWTTSEPLRAAQADSCQDCRDYHKACVKAHSQNACKSEYDICMKHCQRK